MKDDYLTMRINNYTKFINYDISKKNCKDINNLRYIKIIQNWAIYTGIYTTPENIPVLITMNELTTTNYLLISTLQLFTHIVYSKISPHFQIYYGDDICNKVDKYYTIVTVEKVNPTISFKFGYNENMNVEGNFYDFIKNYNINTYNITFNNAITQCILAILAFNIYITNITIENMNGNNFIYHKIPSGGFYHYKIYDTDYYVENLGFLFVFSLIYNPKIIPLTLQSEHDDSSENRISSFINTITSFIKSIKEYYEKSGNKQTDTFIDKLYKLLEECNNTNKQLPNLYLFKTIHSITQFIILKKILLVYTTTHNKPPPNIINSEPFIINKTI